MPTATTPVLHIAYAEHGPAAGYPLMLLPQREAAAETAGRILECFPNAKELCNR